jgi:hypothetical protein
VSLYNELVQLKIQHHLQLAFKATGGPVTMIEHLLTIYKTTDVASVDPAFVLTPDTP